MNMIQQTRAPGVEPLYGAREAFLHVVTVVGRAARMPLCSRNAQQATLEIKRFVLG
jgi:hypothetical protein